MSLSSATSESVTRAVALPARPPLRLVPRVSGAAQSISDEQIVEAVQRGDQQVARLLFARLHTVVDRALFRVFGRREPDHDDLTQVVFEQIVITLTRRSYAGECNLRTWAASIARHVGSTALRSRRRERRVFDRTTGFDVHSVPASVNEESMSGARLDLGRVREHLVAMKRKHAEVVYFHDVLGHPLTEVAELTQVSLSAATSRLVRGRTELYRRLDQDRAMPSTVGRGAPGRVAPGRGRPCS